MLALQAVLLGALAATSLAQITACPTAEQWIVTEDGSKYAVCQQSDYPVYSTKMIGTVATLNDCVKACNNDGACKFAVYDKINFVCHFKAANPAAWTADARFTTFRFLSKYAAGDAVNACPSTETMLTTISGVTYGLCPYTDYQGGNTNAVDGVTSPEACVKICDQTAKCSKTSFSAQDGVCYLKDSTDDLQWSFNSAFGSSRKISAVAQGTAIQTCPGGETVLDTVTGRTFTKCQNANFLGANLASVSAASVEACAKTCGNYATCARAVFDKTGKKCILKSASSDAQWVFDNRYSTLRSTASIAATQGRWSAVIPFPIIPVAAYVVPADPKPARLLVFSSYGARAFSGPTGITQFADYNFDTGAVSQRTVTNTKHDMFCPGISAIMGGKIVITGGSNAEAVSVYDPATNNFARVADMKIPRGYQSSATLSNGKVFTIGGSFTGGLGDKTGEVYDPVANTWTTLNGCDPTPLLTTDKEGIWRTDNHAWLFGWRDGSVFQAGPSKAMNWYYTNGAGSVKPAGVRETEMDQMCGVFAMYDTGKIFSAGGSQDYTDSPGTKRADLITITDPGTPATSERLPDMNFARGFANAVVLPDGKVIVTGGQARSLVFTDIDSVLIPEMWDPVTRQFTQLAPAAIPRNYHAVSLLLPDGTVFVGGGGMCPAAQGDNLKWCDRAKDHFDGEILSPPYLFTDTGALATRPTISSASPTSTTVGNVITVVMGNSQAYTFSLVRMGSATHSVNTDQRRISLPNFTKVGATHKITLPADSGILIPGSWYLFAISSTGVPSVARTINIRV